MSDRFMFDLWKGICSPSLRAGLFALGVVLVLAKPAAAEDESTPCDSDGQLFAPGDVLAGCDISPVADIDFFELPLSAGDNVRILLTRTGGGGSPCLEIRDPSNLAVIGQTCNIRLRLEFVAPESGLYRLIASEGNNDTTVLFNLSAERLAPLRNPVPISYGEVLTDLMINPVADLDTFSFSGLAGSETRIVATRTAGGGTPCIEVRDPENSVVIAETCGVVVDVSAALVNSGTYQVIATEGNSDTTITFNLSLQCIFGPCGTTPPACLVDLSTDQNNTLTLDVTLATPEAARWDLHLDTLFGDFLLAQIPIPVVDPAVGFQIPIANFPDLGDVVVWSSLNTADGVTCFDFDRIDSGPAPSEPTPPNIEAIRRAIQSARR